MHLITKSCVLFLWMQTLDFVKSEECTLEQFRNSNLYDEHFDIASLASSYRQGKQVRVGCSPGFSGFFKLTCTENGWQSTGSKCQPRSCGHPGDAEFADFHLESGDDFVFGSRVVYTCHKGYQMVSRKNFRRCVAQGWDGTIPVCEAQSCPTIKVADNIIVIGDVDGANYGNVLRFSCKNSNHALYGSVEIYCKENGDWSSNPPTCQEVTCSRPLIQNGHVPGDAQVYKENEYLTFRCNDGYIPVEERAPKCTKVGDRAEWSPTPMCEPIICKVTLLPGIRYDPPYKNTFLPGEALRVTCGRDQWISDRETNFVETRCKNDGRWTTEPVCKEYRCSRPQDQTLYSWYSYGGQETKLGNTAWYNCKTGYKKPVNNGRATCTRAGWTPDPLCLEITCPRVDHPEAKIVGDIQSVYKYNQRVKYACNIGFEGTFTITCTDHGWSQQSQECKEITCSKHDIEDAVISNSKPMYQNNEEARYRCSNGKEITRRCENGAWIGPKACSACPKATINHGFFAGPYNDKLYFACDEGYKPFTKGWWGEAKCKDGQLDVPPKCIEKDKCGEPPQIPNGIISDTGVITCNEGYSDQIHQLNCHKGNWNLNGVPLKNICQSTDDHCGPPPKVENAVVVGRYKKKYLADSEVTYQCRDKYTPETEHRRRCIGGQWETNNINCIPYCERFTDKRQTMVFTTQKDKYVNGDEINYKCLVSEEKGTATCMNSEWNTTVVCEAKTCPEPEIFHGYYQYLKGSELIYGASIKYYCEEGYKMEGESDTNECSIEGWTKPSPICKQITCELRIDHPNLRVNPQPDENQPFVIRQRVRFSCTNDFSLKGSSEIECLPTGLWSEDVPTCSDKCQVTEPSPNVNVDPPVGTQLAEGEKLTFSCRLRGHVIKGKETVTCLANAEWSDDFPTCGNPSYCGRPPSLPNGDTTGTASKSQYSHDEKVQYSCQRFYTMQGEPYRTCISGEWIGEMKCLKPCTVDRAAMSERNIQFRYGHEEKLYSPHRDNITFACTWRRQHDGQVAMRQMCNDGVMNLPRCV